MYTSVSTFRGDDTGFGDHVVLVVLPEAEPAPHRLHRGTLLPLRPRPRFLPHRVRHQRHSVRNILLSITFHVSNPKILTYRNPDVLDFDGLFERIAKLDFCVKGDRDAVDSESSRKRRALPPESVEKEGEVRVVVNLEKHDVARLSVYWAVQKNLVKGCRQTLDCYCVSCELLSASIADAL